MITARTRPDIVRTTVRHLALATALLFGAVALTLHYILSRPTEHTSRSQAEPIARAPIDYAESRPTPEDLQRLVSAAADNSGAELILGTVTPTKPSSQPRPQTASAAPRPYTCQPINDARTSASLR